jgi:hypothetical protein
MVASNCEQRADAVAMKIRRLGSGWVRELRQGDARGAGWLPQ